MNNFYIYGHYTADTDELFYIGKGKGRRAWQTKSRNRYWQFKVQKHGLVVKLLEEGLTEEIAYQRERELILATGLDNLTNMTEGGTGFTSEGMKKIFQDPENKKKLALAAQKRAQDPIWRQKITEFNRAKVHNPEYQKKHRAAMKRLGESTTFRQTMKAVAARVARNPIRRARISQGLREFNATPEGKKLLQESIKKRGQNPKWKENLTAGIRRRFADPVELQKAREMVVKIHAKNWGSFISPTGEIHLNVYNMNEFCRTHGLHDPAKMTKVSRGIRKSYKKWRKYIPPHEIHSQFFNL